MAAGQPRSAAPGCRLPAGHTVLWRHFQRDLLAEVRTGVVVADDGRDLMLWVPEGAPVGRRLTVDGRCQRDMSFVRWLASPTRLAPDRWRGPGVLMYQPGGAAHGVWWFWRPDGRFRGWYVNLEQPAVRWRAGDVAGLDLSDQDLDMWVEPDRRWVWKDEEEFAERLAVPDGYWVEDGAAVRAEGNRVARLIEAGAFPFDGSWTDFRPDPAWTVPDRLPAGWDRPRSPAPGATA